MNSRAARQLRRYAAIAKRPYRAVKHGWTRAAAPQRTAFRREVVQAILDADPQAE